VVGLQLLAAVQDIKSKFEKQAVAMVLDAYNLRRTENDLGVMEGIRKMIEVDNLLTTETYIHRKDDGGNVRLYQQWIIP
jgi:hypothetical protein